MGHSLDTGVPEDFKTVLRLIPLPAELGIGGQISTGWLLAKLDQAGAVLPCGVFTAPAMLVELGPITIRGTLHLGDCVTFRAKLRRADADFAEVEIEALTERRDGSEQIQLLRTHLTYVPAPQDEAGNFFSMPFNQH